MLTQITAAESNLIATARATTAALDAVAVGSLDAAIADLEHAALAAGDRLESAASRYVAALSGLVARLSGVAGMLASATESAPKEKVPLFPVPTQVETPEPVVGVHPPCTPETPALPDTTPAEDDAEPDSTPADGRYRCAGCGRRFHFGDYAPGKGYVGGECGHCGGSVEDTTSFDATPPSDEMLATVRAELDAWDTMDGVTVTEGESHRMPGGVVEHVIIAANPPLGSMEAKKARALDMLEANPAMSNREIAKRCGIDKDTVRKLRRGG